MAIFTAAYETNGICSIQLRTGTDTPTAQHAVMIPKRIAWLFDATAQGDVLDSTRVGSLGEQQFRHVPSQLSDSVRICADHHSLLHEQRAGGGYLRRPVFYMLDDAETTGAGIGKIRRMAEVRYTDAVLYRGIEHACPLW